MNKHLLVLGAGFVGREIVREARDGGWLVTAVSRSGGLGGVVGDITSEADLVRLASVLDVVPTHVVHCASASISAASPAERFERYQSVYRDGCANILKAFPNARVLFTSSSSVYAQQEGEVVTEESAAAPVAETAKVLLEAESLVLEAGGIVARLSGIYGQGRAYMLKRLFSGEAAIEADGSRMLNHIHNVDAARACLFLLENGGVGEIYNVTDSESLSQWETYQRLSKAFGQPMPSVIKNPAMSKRGVSSKMISNNKLVELGWSPLYPCFADAAKELDLRSCS